MPRGGGLLALLSDSLIILEGSSSHGGGRPLGHTRSSRAA